MFKGVVLYNYFNKEDEYKGGRLIIQEVTENGEVIKESKAADFNNEEYLTLTIPLELDFSKAQSIHVTIAEDNTVHSGLEKAPRIHLKTVLKELAFKEYDFYNPNYQNLEAEMEKYLPESLSTKRIFVGANNIQIAPIVVLNTSIEDCDYLAVSLSKMKPIDIEVLGVAFLQAVLFKAIALESPVHLIEEVYKKIRFEGAMLPPLSYLLNEGVVVCVRCKYKKQSTLESEKCPKCSSYMTSKKELYTAW